MVDTKDQSNAIVYGILFVDTVDMKIKAHNALNAMFVETVDTLVFVALTQHLIQSTMTGWPWHRENREFGSYFFQTGKTQGIWF